MAVTHVHVDNMANMAGYTPKETAELMSRIGAQRGRARPDKIFFSAFMAGCLVSFTSASAVIATASPWFQENAPGLIRMISGLIFPSGIVMILISGSELFTGSNMITGISWMHGRLPLKNLLLHWFLCFWGNMAGALFVMAIIVGYGGVFDNEVFKKQAIANAQAKQIHPQWHQIFLRAIGCNWLVCLSCYLGLQAKDVTSKVAGMWWPIFAFVTMGLEHVVANMFFIPIGIFLGAPGVSALFPPLSGTCLVAVSFAVSSTTTCISWERILSLLMVSITSSRSVLWRRVTCLPSAAAPLLRTAVERAATPAGSFSALPKHLPL
ncbi:putative transporter [Triangularia verruculosa]|uniref:Transporter n=1 Tax=Triangularia verruculosa TaxID=2587418 RepID=A0AAN6X8E5_9PEZI|nr:putative transporter [Triangularia verruculosa]